MQEKDGDKSDESKPGNDQKKDLAAAKDTDSDCSSGQESSSDDEDSKNDSGDFEVQLFSFSPHHGDILHICALLHLCC